MKEQVRDTYARQPLYLQTAGILVAVGISITAVLVGATEDVVLGLLQLTFLLGICTAVIARVQRLTRLPLGMLLLGLAGQIVGSTAMSYFVAVDGGDAIMYYTVANSLVDGTVSLSSLDWYGTDLISILASFWYRLFGSSWLGSFYLSGMLGYWARCIVLVTLVNCVPNERIRTRISLLLLLMPSFWMWHGLFGKEGYTALGIALTLYGVSLLNRRFLRAVTSIIVGVLITGLVRPHFAVLELGALTMAIGLGKGRRARYPTLILVLTTFVIMATSDGFQRFIGSEVSPVEVADRLVRQNELLSTGGSASGIQVNSGGIKGYLSLLPYTILSILLFPYPGQFMAPLQILASLETMLVFIVILKMALRSIATALRTRNLTALYAWAFSCAFVATVGINILANIGLMVRQRTFVWLALFVALSFGTRTPERVWDAEGTAPD